MSFPKILTAVLVTVVLSGCGGSGDATGLAGDPIRGASPTPAATAPAPPRTPSPSAAPSAPDLSGLSAVQLMTKAKAATLAATGFRVRGQISDGADRIQLDLQLTRSAGEGRFVVVGGPVTYRVVGKTIYMLMSDAMIRAVAKKDKLSAAELDATLKVLGGKWIKTSKLDQDSKDMVELVSRDTFVRGFFSDVGRPVKTARKVVDGVSSIGLRADGSTLWVDVRTARPVRLDAGKDQLTFTDFGRIAAPEAPPAGQTLDGKAFGL